MLKQKWLRTAWLAGGAGMGFSLLTPPLATAQQAERFELSGRAVAVYNLAGTVTLRAAGGSAVVVELTRGGRDAGDLRIETGPFDDHETLRVIYPADRVVYDELGHRSRTDVRVRENGTFGDSWGRSERGERVRISDRGDGMEAFADLDISVPSGQRVAVYLAVGEVRAMNVEGDLLLDTHSAPVEASGIRGSLSIDVGSGSVDVAEVSGDVKLDTGSGSVDARQVRGDMLHIDTGSGSVTVSDATATELNIDTGSGRIRADGVSAQRVQLDTGSGSIDFELLNNADVIEIDTGSGGVTLTVPDAFGAEVDLETGSGGIELDMPVTMRRFERDHVRGTIGDGRGRLMIDTGSGSIRIRRGS
jgi:DUF4097 and DUF4098 domain-containing protein YvlB